MHLYKLFQHVYMLSYDRKIRLPGTAEVASVPLVIVLSASLTNGIPSAFPNDHDWAFFRDEASGRSDCVSKAI
jgi:hypothetical protein